ncbi:hypothetical protein B0H16DRAFT_1592904 [Mycena metata]|uniref:RING-type domain-containing protein n=1 Tax=Mycena metata TaxID=1033252 RepID=A0AAD7MPJ7_9AGAR|nr:hypothetical protein B0H16DRAFT_1592904 [Mycena metata]
MTAGASLQSVKTPRQRVRDSFMPYNRPLDDPSASDGNEDSFAGSSSSGQRQRTSQASTSSIAPRRPLEESPREGTSSPHISPPLLPCDLCPFSLQAQAPYTNVNQPIRDITTTCQHRFHHACYMVFLTTAPVASRASCPKCGGNLLSDDSRYWVNVTTNAGNQCYTDMTDEVEERFATVRLARQQILFEFINSGNINLINLAASLLTGPDAVDVNYRTPSGGFTALHVCAVYNNIAGIDFLLSHDADRHQKSDEGFMAIDYAKANKSLAAVTRLT